MNAADALPDGLDRLSVALPPGRLVTPEDATHPAYWLSDDPPDAALWPLLRAAHPTSGLWPLLLGGLDGELDRPWVDGETEPSEFSSPADHDAATVLAAWFRGCWQPEHPRITAPYGEAWPGLAPAAEPRTTPEAAADDLARGLAKAPRRFGVGGLRIGLVAAERGADALTVAGWTGPLNHVGDTAEISAVVRSWEDRFGVRVVGVGFATLHLSVAAPPATRPDALRVAAEHFAFCPDSIWQGTDTLAAYAATIQGTTTWSFWWD